MKKEHGVTLISLIIYPFILLFAYLYIIVLLFVLTIVTKLTSALYFNLHDMDKQSDAVVSISKFNMYFLNDIKNKPVTASVSGTDSIELTYSNNSEKITYSKTNKALYRNKVKVFDNLDEITITKTGQTIQVYLKIGDYSKIIKYTIEQKAI